MIGDTTIELSIVVINELENDRETEKSLFINILIGK